MTTKEVLTDARQLIADEAAWVQGVRETLGGQRCAMGAICFAATGSASARAEASSPVARAARRALLKITGLPVMVYNDSHDHHCVVEGFNEAIAQCDE